MASSCDPLHHTVFLSLHPPLLSHVPASDPKPEHQSLTYLSSVHLWASLLTSQDTLEGQGYIASLGLQEDLLALEVTRASIQHHNTYQ